MLLTGAQERRATPRWLKSAGGVAAVGVICIAAVLLAISVVESLLSPQTASYDIRPFLLCLGLVILSVGTYLVWFDRWNIVAHTQLAFSLIAYVVPIFGLHQLDDLNDDALDAYYRIVVVGAVVYTIGLLIGASTVSRDRVIHLYERASFHVPHVQAILERRTMGLALLAVAGVLVSFAVMGFAPALAGDPLAAKFFRGAYAAPYAHVAPLYRLASTAVIAVLPLLAAYALRRRARFAAKVLLLASIAVLVLALTRQAAVQGLLLLLGVAVAVRRRSLTLYLVALVAAYVAGALAYNLLHLFGLDSFVGVPGAAETSFWAQVSAGAPDIRDQVHFMTGYLQHPLPAGGRTFWGGLLPNRYEWNSSVYSLRVVNPGVDISQIQSGGLRLPAPIWGFANFGWAGVVGVSLVAGAISGYLARLFKRLTPSTSVVTSMCWLSIYVALLGVLPVFYRSQYLAVLQLLVAWWLLFYRTRPEQRAQHPSPERLASHAP